MDANTCRPPFECVEVVMVTDGDTFRIKLALPPPFDRIAVRVSGIDTPELRSKDECERELAAYAFEVATYRLTLAKRVDLVDVQPDKYFRINAIVLVDGESLGRVLLEAGLAAPYDGGTKVTTWRCTTVVL